METELTRGAGNGPNGADRRRQARRDRMRLGLLAVLRRGRYWQATYRMSGDLGGVVGRRLDAAAVELAEALTDWVEAKEPRATGAGGRV